jgi:hypothetical protein
MRIFGIIFCLLVTFTVDGVQQLANYLGTGSNPRISLVLSPDNGPHWGSYNLDYQGVGNVPWSKDPANDWSPWDAKDQDGNYYGTITLKSDGETVTWGNYTPGKDGYYFEGVHLTMNEGIKAYQLTVDQIHVVPSSGPFPNAPLAQPALYPGTDEPITLSVKEDKIINRRGESVILKGVARPSLEWNPQGQYLSVEDIDRMKRWGANVIRLDLNQNYWLQSQPVSVPGSYKQIINAIVYYATQKGMAVILDLHWTENGHQSPMADNNSITFWQQVATDYKNFGTVLFELFNEPQGIDKETWLNGNGTYVGYQQLYNAVRKVGANNVVIVNGLDWGYDLSFVSDSFKLTGDNIVYGSHPYDEKGSLSYTGPGGPFANNFKGIIGKFPLIFTEFGVNSAPYFPNGYQTVYARTLDYVNQNQVNYSAFAWWVDPNSAKSDTFPDIIKDWSGTPLNGGFQIKQDIEDHPPTKLN